MSNLNYHPDDVAAILEMAREVADNLSVSRVNMLRVAFDNADLNANFCSVTEAAQISDLSAPRLTDLLRTNQIQGRKQGRDWMVNRADLERFISEPRERKPRRTRAQIIADATQKENTQ